MSAIPPSTVLTPHPPVRSALVSERTPPGSGAVTLCVGRQLCPARLCEEVAGPARPVQTSCQAAFRLQQQSPVAGADGGGSGGAGTKFLRTGPLWLTGARGNR